MVNFESIKETVVPPIVATIIAIGLVSDWSSAETPDSAVAPDASTTTASRSMQADSHIKKQLSYYIPSPQPSRQLRPASPKAPTFGALSPTSL